MVKLFSLFLSAVFFKFSFTVQVSYSPVTLQEYLDVSETFSEAIFQLRASSSVDVLFLHFVHFQPRILVNECSNQIKARGENPCILSL